MAGDSSAKGNCNSITAKSFVPISGKEKNLFLRLQKIIEAGDYGVFMSVDDVNRLLGWVKIPY